VYTINIFFDDAQIHFSGGDIDVKSI